MKPITEAEFTEQVIELARMFGWRTAHFRPAMTKRGWRTPVQGDGKGFPDLILIRGIVCLAVELKSVGGKVRPEQEEWIRAFNGCGIKSMVWTPDDLPKIVETLKKPGADVRLEGAK